MMVERHHGAMKVRAQIQLDPEDHDALKRFAEAHGVSFSGAVRWLVRERLRPGRTVDDPITQGLLDASGCIVGDEQDGRVSEEHDLWLYGGRGT